MLEGALVSSLQLILDKVITICKQTDRGTLPSKISVAELFNVEHRNKSILSIHQKQSEQCLEILNTYSIACDQIRSIVYEYHQFQHQYQKLEEQLQKNETQLRRHIGVEQELKLYMDTLNIQYQESQYDRLQLLNNSKRIIKELKAKNQKLCMKLSGEIGGNSAQKSLSKKKSIRSSNKKHDTNDSKYGYGKRDRISTQYHTKDFKHKKQHEINYFHPSKLAKHKNTIIKSQKKQQSSHTNLNNHNNSTTLPYSKSHKKKLTELQKKQQNNYMVKNRHEKLFKDHTPIKNLYTVNAGTDRKKVKKTKTNSNSKSKSKSKSNRKIHNKSVFSVSSMDMQQHPHEQIKVVAPHQKYLEEEHNSYGYKHFYSHSEELGNDS